MTELHCGKKVPPFAIATTGGTFRSRDVLRVSPDSVAAHGKFKAKMKFPFELGCDADRKLARLFRVWKEKNMYGRKVMGIEHSTFLPDAAGALRQGWRRVRVDGHAAAVLEAAQAL